MQEWDAQDCDDSDQTEYSGEWCHGCDNPREECCCRPMGAVVRRPMRRETGERAIAKALEHSPVVIQVDHDFWAVASASRAGAGYLVERDPATGDLWCPCKAAEFTGCCYQRAAVGLVLGTISASWLPVQASAGGDECLRIAS